MLLRTQVPVIGQPGGVVFFILWTIFAFFAGGGFILKKARACLVRISMYMNFTSKDFHHSNKREAKSAEALQDRDYGTAVHGSY